MLRRSETSLSFSAVSIMILSFSITQGPEIRKRSSDPHLMSPTLTIFFSISFFKLNVCQPHSGQINNLFIREMEAQNYRYRATAANGYIHLMRQRYQNSALL